MTPARQPADCLGVRRAVLDYLWAALETSGTPPGLVTQLQLLPTFQGLGLVDDLGLTRVRQCATRFLLTALPYRGYSTRGKPQRAFVLLENFEDPEAFRRALEQAEDEYQRDWDETALAPEGVRA